MDLPNYSNASCIKYGIENQDTDFLAKNIVFDENGFPTIVTDIYAARENNTYNITSEDLVNEIIKLGKNAKYIPSIEDCASYLKEHVKQDDLVLTLGAGTVTEIGPMIVE